MTVNEVRREISGLTKLQREEKAYKLFTEVATENRELRDQLDSMGIDGAALTNLSPILAIAVASDGKLSSAEYNTYVKMCVALDIEADSFEKCESLARIPGRILDLVREMSEIMTDLYRKVGYSGTMEKFTIALACLLSEDGDIDDNEMRLLSYFCDTDSYSNTVDNGDLNWGTNRTEPIVLIRHNAVFTRDDDEYIFSIGAELKNPNLKHCANDVQVRVLVKDASGRTLATSDNRIDYIDSNAVFYFGDEISIDRGVPASYTIQVNCDDFVSAPENSSFSDGITCSHYGLDTDRWGRTIFSGNVHNSYNRKLWVDLYFVFYDSAGNITGGTQTTCTNLYGNSEDAFEIRLDTNAQRNKVKCSASFDFMQLMH